MYPSESQAAVKMGKKLVAARDLAPGEILEQEDVVARSPGDGVPPSELELFLGRRLRRAVTKDAALSFEAIEEFESSEVPLARRSVSRQ
jgi:sialic acid synthase SpsE